MLYSEKLYDKYLLVLASSGRPICLNLTERKFFSFKCCRLLENDFKCKISYLEAPKQTDLRMKNFSRMRNT